MFSLGLIGIVSIAAAVLLAIYAIAALLFKIAIVAFNRSPTPIYFDVGTRSIAKISVLAWAVGVVLFALCSVLNYWFTQYSGNTISRMYPALVRVTTVGMFCWFLAHRASSRSSSQEVTPQARVLWALVVSAVPVVLLLGVANIWSMSRGHS